jgi:hypothetical protein
MVINKHTKVGEILPFKMLKELRLQAIVTNERYEATCLPPEEGEAYKHVSYQKRERHKNMKI